MSSGAWIVDTGGHWIQTGTNSPSTLKSQEKSDFSLPQSPPVCPVGTPFATLSCSYQDTHFSILLSPPTLSV